MTDAKKEPFGIKILGQARPLDVALCNQVALKPPAGRKYENGYNSTPIHTVPFAAAGAGLWRARHQTEMFELVPQKDTRTANAGLHKVNYCRKYFIDLLIVNTPALLAIDPWMYSEFYNMAIDYYIAVGGGAPPGNAHYPGPWVGLPGMNRSFSRLLDRFGPTLLISVNMEIEDPPRIFAQMLDFYVRSVLQPPDLQLQYCLEPVEYPIS